MLNLDFSVFPVLVTERLILRQLNNDDTNELFFLRSDEKVLRLIGKEPAKDINKEEELFPRVNE